MGYPTKALLQLKNETNVDLQMDDYLGSWFAASFWIAGIFWCPLGGWLGGLLGRRKIILLTAPLVLAGWAVLATASNITSLFFGRMISAMAVTCHMSSVGKDGDQGCQLEFSPKKLVTLTMICMSVYTFMESF